jgi:hypothetical protein
MRVLSRLYAVHSMSDQDQTNAQAGPEPDAAPTPRRGGFQPGKSGNPGGRRAGALSFAERVRQRVDPDQLIDKALEIALDDKAAKRDQLAALTFLHGAGWTKPPAESTVNVNATAQVAPAIDWSRVPLEQRRAALAALQAARAAAALPVGVAGAIDRTDVDA